MSHSLDLSSLQNAVLSLANALEETGKSPANDLLRDGCIQRFEYTYELCWKMLKRRLNQSSLTHCCPR